MERQDDFSSDDETALPCTIRAFGGMRVEALGAAVSIGGPRQRRLLALLALDAGETVSLDRLSEHLWADDDRPDPAAPALRTFVSRLRSALPEMARPWIVTEPGGYRLDAPALALDHRRLMVIREQGRHARDLGDPQRAHRLLGDALQLCRGGPFVELQDVDIAQPLIERLNTDRLEMMEERWEVALELGLHTEIVGELAGFTAAHGLRDRAVRQHALALHRAGRTAEGLRVLDRHRRALAEESGLEATREVVDLEAALLSNDPALDVERAGVPLRGYRLIEPIGEGTFSVVWRATQPSVGRDVAIKQIRAELAARPEFIRGFEAEAQTIARLEHPHIVPMIDFWRDPDSAYLVMRWLRQGTLAERLAAETLSLDEVLGVATQVGDALAASHRAGVVHRDVKPSNIYADDGGNWYLGDFGIAADLAASYSSSIESSSHGSRRYAPPEQVAGGFVDARADVFGLAATLVDALGGSVPGATDLPESAPVHVRAALSRALAPDPADRTTSIAELLSDLEGRSWVPPGEGQVNPYLGLRAFDETDHARFFGRSTLVRELVDALDPSGRSPHCLVVVGPSGSGKSSVVRAGLLPALRDGAIEGSAEWFTTVMVPDGDPFESLESALLRVAVDPPFELLDRLRDGPRGIVRAVRRCLGSDRDRILLVIDQLEEIFTAADPADAERFLAGLAMAVEDATSPLRLVATLRADFYARPLQHATFASVLKQSAVDVTPLSADELESAIVGPAAAVGIGFEPGLATLIATDAFGQASPLPALQHAMRQLFERRADGMITRASYDAIGGLAGALSSEAEALFGSSDAEEQGAVRRLFGSLANPDEGAADVRRRARLADLGDEPPTVRAIRRYGDARLLSFDREAGSREPTVEVAHEALFRDWPRLAGWLGEDRTLLRVVGALQASATQWDAAGRPESDLYRGVRLESAVVTVDTAGDRLRELDVVFVEASQRLFDAERRAEEVRVKRLRRLLATLAVALIGALGAGVFALGQQRRADDEAATARTAAAEAEAQARLAEDQRAIAQEQTAVAEAEAERAEREAAAAEAAVADAEVATLISRSAALTDEEPAVGILLALEAHRRAPGSQTELAVLNAIASSSLPNRLQSLQAAPTCGRPVASPDGFTVFAVDFGTLVEGDLFDRLRLLDEPHPDDCGQWARSVEHDRRWAESVDGLSMWFGPHDGPWGDPVRFTEPVQVLHAAFTPAGTLAVGPLSGGGPFGLIDDDTGAWVGVPMSATGEVLTGRAALDGEVVVFSLTDGVDGGRLVVVDGATGTVRGDVDLPEPGERIVVDTARREVVAVGSSQVVTIDLDTAVVVATVSYRPVGRLLDAGVQSDGSIAVVSEGEVALVDRRAGLLEPPTVLRNAQLAWLRSDGTLGTFGSDARVDLFELGTRPLFERAIDVADRADVSFGWGRAVAVETRSGRVSVIDLESGDARSVDSLFAEGERFAPVGGEPGPEAVWLVDADGRVGRLDGSTVVDVESLGGVHVADVRHEDTWVVLVDGPEGRIAEVLSLADGFLTRGVPIPADGALFAQPVADGLLLFDETGRVRTYDDAGELVVEQWLGGGRFDLGGRGPRAVAVDDEHGSLAVAGAVGPVVIFDLATGDVRSQPAREVVVNLGFTGDGALLVVTGADGTVRLWDVAQESSAGVIWTGGGAEPGSPSWYDPATDTVWVATADRLLQFSASVDRWLEVACQAAGRNLTREEWDTYVPGDALLWFSCLDQIRPVEYEGGAIIGTG